MSINMPLILSAAEDLAIAMESKSWHHTVNAAHACLCAMPSPAWAEREPGIAVYGPGEAELNQRVNVLRRYVLQCMLAMIDPDQSWEAGDTWPQPTGLRNILRTLFGSGPIQAVMASPETTL